MKIALTTNSQDSFHHSVYRYGPKLFEKRVHLNEKDHHSCSGTLGIYVDQAGLDAGFTYDGLHLVGNVVEAVVGRSGYVYGSLHLMQFVTIFFKPLYHFCAYIKYCRSLDCIFFRWHRSSKRWYTIEF